MISLMWCGPMHIAGPFCFNKKSNIAQIYLDVLTEYVLSPHHLVNYQLQVFSNRTVHHVMEPWTSAVFE